MFWQQTPAERIAYLRDLEVQQSGEPVHDLPAVDEIAWDEARALTPTGDCNHRRAMWFQPRKQSSIP